MWSHCLKQQLPHWRLVGTIWATWKQKSTFFPELARSFILIYEKCKLKIDRNNCGKFGDSPGSSFWEEVINVSAKSESMAAILDFWMKQKVNNISTGPFKNLVTGNAVVLEKSKMFQPIRVHGEKWQHFFRTTRGTFVANLVIVHTVVLEKLKIITANQSPWQPSWISDHKKSSNTTSGS